MKIRFGLIAACLLAITAIAPAKEPSINELGSATPAIAAAALDQVLANADTTSASALYIAAGAALKAGKLSDAGFLFYAARIRTAFDQALFPPRGAGGDSPLVALGALQFQLGSSLNPTLMADPKAYAAAVEKVKAWTPRAPDDYQPGWEYKQRTTLKAAEDAIRDLRAKFIEQMGSLSTLLNDERYFAAFRTVQKFNRGPATERPPREAYDAALKTMREIETVKGIPGPASRVKG
ncbi:MAG: hypothetical protein HYV96_06560 [Opitutae bacterium]|nr:hypothetical protein [Opitutae bacterium]